MSNKDIQSRLVPMRAADLDCSTNGAKTTTTSFDTQGFNAVAIALNSAGNASNTGTVLATILENDANTVGTATVVSAEKLLPTGYIDADGVEQDTVTNAGVLFAGERWTDIAPIVPTIGVVGCKRYVWLRLTVADVAASGMAVSPVFIGIADNAPNAAVAGTV